MLELFGRFCGRHVTNLCTIAIYGKRTRPPLWNTLNESVYLHQMNGMRQIFGQIFLCMFAKIRGKNLFAFVEYAQ
jgi:hypothetical protein